MLERQRKMCYQLFSCERKSRLGGNDMKNRDGQMVVFGGKGLGTKSAITHQAKLHTITALSYFYPLGRVVS